MSNDKMKAEFEAWYLAATVDLLGQGVRSQAQKNLAWTRDDGSYVDPALRLALMAWQASRAAEDSSYVAIIEDLERARIAGFDGYDFKGLKDRKGDQKVFEISIETERGCSIDEGEYTVRVTNLLGCWLGDGEFELIEDAVANIVVDLELPEEGHTTFIAYESGERQDVFWTKWFEIVPVSAVVKS